MTETSITDTLITPAGLARLNEELERLKSIGRETIAERIRYAVSTDADPTANADYLAAREEQALHESRIARLEQRLASARVAEPDVENDVVDLGELVLLRDLDTGTRYEYELVGSFEADPGAGRISVESPLGRALVGLGAGDVAIVEAPKGRRRLKVLGIGLPVAAA